MPDELKKLWEEFAESPSNNCGLSTNVDTPFIALWSVLESKYGDKLPYPTVYALTGENGLCMSWVYERAILFFEITNHAEIEWFARDRKTLDYDGGTFLLSGGLPEEIENWLELICLVSKID